MAKQQSPIYEQLKQDHQVVKQILEKMEASGEKAIKERQRLMGQLKKELLAHAHAEEHVLYHELEQHKESKSLALEAEEEHQVAEKLLADIEQTDPADEHWLAKVKVLKELIEHHIEEEEAEMFSQAREVLDEDVAVKLGQRFEQEKKQEQQRL
jgi:hypothetical protein